MQQYYEIHICTQGERNYAEQCTRVIDADDKIFKKRMVCRDDTPDISHKILQRITPCDERMVLVLDDRVDVWQASALNVLKIHPFHFFTGLSEMYNRNSSPKPPAASSSSSTSTASVSSGSAQVQAGADTDPTLDKLEQFAG